MASGTIAAAFGIPWHQELLERNEIAGDSRPNRSAADGLFRKTWPSQPDNWEMKPRNRDCKSANADCQTAITIAALQTPIVGQQSRLQRCKRQLSGCNHDCSAANANCQAAATTGNRHAWRPQLATRSPNSFTNAQILSNQSATGSRISTSCSNEL